MQDAVQEFYFHNSDLNTKMLLDSALYMKAKRNKD